MNSRRLISAPVSKRFLKSARANVCATVEWAASSIKFWALKRLNQWLLNTTSVFSASNTLKTCSLYVLALRSTSSGDIFLRSSFRPVGSPTCAVKSPIRNTTRCPKSWNCFIFLSNTTCPRWISGAVGSKPALITKGFLSAALLVSFFSNNSTEMISVVPREMIWMAS